MGKSGWPQLGRQTFPDPISGAMVPFLNGGLWASQRLRSQVAGLAPLKEDAGIVDVGRVQHGSGSRVPDVADTKGPIWKYEGSLFEHKWRKKYLETSYKRSLLSMACGFVGKPPINRGS